MHGLRWEPHSCGEEAAASNTLTGHVENTTGSEGSNHKQPETWWWIRDGGFMWILEVNESMKLRYLLLQCRQSTPLDGWYMLHDDTRKYQICSSLGAPCLSSAKVLDPPQCYHASEGCERLVVQCQVKSVWVHVASCYISIHIPHISMCERLWNWSGYQPAMPCIWPTLQTSSDFWGF